MLKIEYVTNTISALVLKPVEIKNLKHNNCLHGWELWFDIQHGPLCYFYGVYRIMGYQILKF